MIWIELLVVLVCVFVGPRLGGVALGTVAATMQAAAGGLDYLRYATLLTAISFDQTGTTRIGKYVLNHSFMIPGMVATVSSVVIAFLIGKLVL